MKRGFSLALTLLLCLALLPACADDQTKTTAPSDAEITRGTLDLSAFTAEGLEGGVYSGEIFRGHKLTMLNVWGTFCGPCIREMPGLERLSQAYGEEFQLIGVVLDAVDQNFVLKKDKKTEAEAILSQTGADYLQLLPSKSLSSLFLAEVQVVPTTIFLDENGVILGEPYYGSKDYDGWKAVVDIYLKALS